MKSRLELSRLIIKGEEYQRTFLLNSSLIIIRGDGFSGKSLLLKLIVYCLGGKPELIDLSVQKELDEFCNEVYLEFSISEQIYTVKRDLKTDKNLINIFLCSFEEYNDYSPWKKDSDDANDFFAKELQISLHSILKRKAGSKDLIKEKISFRDIMRYIFINQGELGTINFLKNNNTFVSGKNKEVFKIINDLLIPDLEQISEEIQITQNEINEKEKVKSGLENYLENKEANVLIQLVDLKETYSKQIQNLLNEKTKLIEMKKDKQSNIFLELKNDVSKFDSLINEKEQYASKIKLSIMNKLTLQADYNEEKMKLTATLEAMKKIKISSHSERCPLCHSIVVIEEDIKSSEDIEIAIRQIDNKLETLKKLLNEERLILLETQQGVSKIEQKKQIYQSALIEYKKNMEIPYLSEIESYNSLIKDITEERNKVNSLIDIHHEIEVHTKALKKLKDNLDVLVKKKNELQNAAKREKDILQKINTRFRQLMYRFNFQDIQADSCYISTDNYLPYYRGISVLKHTSGSLLLCMEIAYIGAILELNAGEKENCHPGLLMIDTVSNNIGTNSEVKDSVDPETYNEIFSYIVELSESNQLIIVDNTPPKIEKEHISYNFRRVKKGEALKGLIDFEYNEMAQADIESKLDYQEVESQNAN